MPLLFNLDNLNPNLLRDSNFLSLNIQKCGIPILVTLLKMQPYYSQSSRENATTPSPPRGIHPQTKTNRLDQDPTFTSGIMIGKLNL